MTPATAPRTLEAGDELAAEALHAVILSDIVTVAGEMSLLEALGLSPRQSKNRLLSPEARREADQMIAKSRHDLLLARSKGINPAVISRPPEPIAVLSLLAEFHAVISGAEASAWRHLNAVPAKTRGTDISDTERLAQLMNLVTQIWDQAWLGSLQRDLADLIKASEAMLDGEPKSVLEAPCPWCGRKTLTFYQWQGVIRCESDYRDGKLEPCLCSSPTCGCKRGKRHSWDRGSLGTLEAMLRGPKS